jgi:hypothetical protein
VLAVESQSRWYLGIKHQRSPVELDVEDEEENLNFVSLKSSIQTPTKLTPK